MALRHRFGLKGAGALALASSLVLAAAPTASGVSAPPDATIQLTQLTPSVLSPDADLTVRGVVRSAGKTWQDAEVYATIPTSPLVNHGQAAQAVTAKSLTTGHRVSGRGTTDAIGTLSPGENRRFRLSLPWASLAISGAEGVYPLTIRVRSRGKDAVTSVTTLLPLRTSAGEPVPTTVLWPFMRPGRALATTIGPNGRLRRLLDLARSSPDRGSEILLDPALVSRVRAVADGATGARRGERDAAADFLHDLIDAAKDRECWTTHFDRPDLTALGAASTKIRTLMRRATRRTLNSEGLRCSLIEWPTADRVGRAVLVSPTNDARAVIVGRSAIPGWQSTSGNLLRIASAGSPTRDLIVDDGLGSGADATTSLGLRQRILSEVTWSALARQAGGRDTTVVVVDPGTEVVRQGESHLKVAVQNKYVRLVSLSKQLKSGTAPFTVGALTTRSVRPALSDAQLSSAAEAAQLQQLLRRIVADQPANLANDQQIASILSQRWVGRGEAGPDYASDVRDRISTALANITVEGPESLTLSSSKGRFPVTVKNKTGQRVAVGTVISSDNPAVRVVVPRSSTIAAGESRTVTASIDMDGQSAATVSIRLTTRDGTIVGSPAVFNVRSSRVGAALWVAIALSVAFVAVALLRRFVRPRHGPDVPPPDPDADDD